MVSVRVVATTRAVQAHRQLRHQRQLRQTELLAEAAVDRAVRRLGRDARYRGETWELAPGGLPGIGPGRARIGVTPLPEDSPRAYRIEVTAQLGSTSPGRIRRSLEMVVSADGNRLTENLSIGGRVAGQTNGN